MISHNQILTLEKTGLSDTQISLRLGYSPYYVQLLRKRKGWPRIHPVVRRKRGEGAKNPFNAYMEMRRQAGLDPKYKVIRIDSRIVAEHVYKAEKVLGRRLKVGEVVHHIDGNPQNNRNDNLIICTQKYHKNILHSLKGNDYIKEKQYRRTA